MLILAVEESTMSVGRARASAPNSACRIRVSGRLATVRYDTVPYLHTCTHRRVLSPRLCAGFVSTLNWISTLQ